MRCKKNIQVNAIVVRERPNYPHARPIQNTVKDLHAT
jgi:hypothetical protein